MSTTAGVVQRIKCPQCGATNRVPQANLDRGQVPVCGRCKTRLPIPSRTNSKPVIVTDDSFSAEVERSDLPVLLDLWAPWCGPCRAMAPVIEELAAQMAGRAKIAKLDVEENPATAARFNVSGIPTLLVLKNGREVDRLVGLLPKEQIAARLERAL